jgi:pimeloyl-ACP methyl ester carboxylesterase
MARVAGRTPVIGRRVVRLEIDGGGLHAEWVTPEAVRDEAVLVLLHEGLGSTGFWKDLPEALAAATGRRVFLYDRRGYGRSDPEPLPRPLDYLERMALEELPAVLDAAGIGRAILLGHSDGGTIALLFAAAFPERVRAVVAIAAHVFVEDATIEGIRAAVRAFERGGLRERLERFHGARTEAVFRAWSDTWLDPRFRSWNVTARLPSITASLLVLQGEADEYATPAQLEAIAGAVRGPVWTRLLPGAGHVPHHQARAATLEAVLGFLAGTLGRSGAEGAGPEGAG